MSINWQLAPDGCAGLCTTDIAFCRKPAGRCTTDITYDVGFEADGKITGLRIDGAMLAGAVQDLAGDDVSLLKTGADMVRFLRLCSQALEICGSGANAAGALQDLAGDGVSCYQLSSMQFGRSTGSVP